MNATGQVLSDARAVVAFSRPHTIIGTVLAVIVLWTMALAWVSVPPTGAIAPLLTTLVAAVAVNVYIVGLNQITDIHIDRINKPTLPLAAGTMTVPTGRILVATTGGIALVVSALAGPFLLTAIIIGLVVGTAYSVAPLRLKRFHVAAAAAISAVRAVVVNLLLFAHFTMAVGPRPMLPQHVWVLTGVVLGLTIAIAWFKDIPDAAGDARHGIATLVLRLGVRRVLTLGLAVLAACYASVVVAGVVGLPGVDGTVLAVGHVALLVALVLIRRQVDIEDPATLTTFYRNIWRLFFAEYIVFGLAALAPALG